MTQFGQFLSDAFHCGVATVFSKKFSENSVSVLRQEALNILGIKFKVSFSICVVKTL